MTFFSTAPRRSLAMDSIQGGNANELCRNLNLFNHGSDIAETQFSSVGDRQRSWTTRYDAGHHVGLSRGLLDERWSPGHATELETCWPQSGWKHVNSTADNGSDSSTGRLHRSWDGLNNAIPCQKRSLHSNQYPLKNEVEFEDDGLILTDIRPTPKESFRSSSSWASLTSKISCNSDIYAASKFRDDLKSLCSEEKISWDCEATHPSGGEMKQSPTAVPVMENARISAHLPNIKGNETRVPQMETNGVCANKSSSSDQRGRFLSVIGIGAGDKANDSNLLRGSASPNGTAGDTVIGLKLGRRTYFEDSSGGGLPKGGTSDPCSTNSPPGKKHKTSSPGGSTPRCQADGCKADLTNSKDYHRRHKVCELHAKASKVKVVGMEQRFCQQCSRFHGLLEFDEGKRSCRRRLAGHNERRRKSQPPEALPLETCSYFPDGKLFSGNFLEGLCFMQQQMTAPSCLNPADSLAHHLHFPTAEMHSFSSALSQPTSDQVHMLLQSSKRHGNNLVCQGSQQFLQGLEPVMRRDFPLFKPSGMVHPSLGPLPTSQSLPETSDSGCASSLLSASPWESTNPTCSLSLGASAHSSLELLLASNGDLSSEQIVPSSSTKGALSSSEVSEDLIAQAPESQHLTASTVVIAGSLDVMDKKQPEESIIPNFDGHLVRVMLQNHEFQGLQGGGSQNGHSTRDLMRIPCPQFQSIHPAILGQLKELNSDFDALKPNEFLFDRQNII